MLMNGKKEKSLKFLRLFVEGEGLKFSPRNPFTVNILHFFTTDGEKF